MMIRTRIGIVCFMLLIFIAPLSAIAQHKWKGTIAKEGDVTVIKNPKKPLYRSPILKFKEDLSIGGAGAQGEYAMGDLRDVVVDEVGTIYVLDWQNNRVQVFDQAGTFVRTIGRKGQGPGAGDTLKASPG